MQLSPDGENVDWRRFLLQAAQPWPLPSQQDLLDALAAMRQMDQNGTGYVTREQFERVGLRSTRLSYTRLSELIFRPERSTDFHA